MASSPANLRSIYRSLLRELPPRPILSSPRSPLHARIRSHFASPSSPSSPSPTSASSPSSNSSSSSSSTQSLRSQSKPESGSAEHAARAAEQLVAYLHSQRLYVSLIERYNPGMEMDQDERIRLTARRVGMDLPVKK